MNQQQIDQLVDLITERVQAALASNTSSAAPAICAGCAAGGPCDAKAVIPQIEEGVAQGRSAGAGAGAPCAVVAPFIDHTLLKPEATTDELRTVCDEARKYGFATVCVNSSNVRFVADALRGTSTKPIAVVGFPLGAATPNAKAFETREAIRNGAAEIDMVLNIGALKSRDLNVVFQDIKKVCEAAGKIPVKVILETAKLSEEEKIIACALSKAAGAAFVKTSTGFGGGGATPEDVALMRSVVGEDMGVKASGGIRTIDDAKAALEAGANRLGASASVAIVKCVRGGDGASKGY